MKRLIYKISFGIAEKFLTHAPAVGISGNPVILYMCDIQ